MVIIKTYKPVRHDKSFPLFNAPFSTRKIDYKNQNKSTTDAYISYYINAKYIFQNRYILSLSARKDESNLFGVNTNQKGVPLWSAGVSWDISQEKFYQPAVGWMPFLKIRVTHGYNGNVDRSVTAFTTAKIDLGSNIWNQPAGTIINPPNPSLRWEKNQMTNFGIDFATKKDIIEGSLEYYLRKGVDLIGNTPVDPTTGNTTFRGNTADMKGNGFDIVIRSKNINHAQFKWYSTFLFSHAIDKVTNYKVQQAAIWYYCDPQYISPLAGNPLYSIYSFKWMGLDHATGNPLGSLKDTVTRDYNAIYTSSDLANLKYIGPANPTYFGSLRNTFDWKQFELSFNITWKWDYYFRRSSINYFNLFNSQLGHPDYEKRWQHPGDEKTTNVPSMVYPAIDIARDVFYTYSDILVEKGDHIRLQDIQVSYDLNKSRYKTLPVQSIRVYLYANNIGIIWRANHYGIDPDFVSGIPNPRSIAAGVKVDF